MNDIVAVASSDMRTYVLSSTGQVYGWGKIHAGTQEVVPTPIPELTDIHSIYEVKDSFYAITNNGEVYAWGRNTGGLLGINTDTPAEVFTPTLVPLPVSVQRLFTVNTLNEPQVFVEGSNSIYAWGFNYDLTIGGYHLGVGHGTQSIFQSPQLLFTIPSGQTLRSVGFKNIQLTNGDVYVWGSNPGHRPHSCSSAAWAPVIGPTE